MTHALALLGLDVKMKLKRAVAFRFNFAVNLLIALLYSFVFSLFQFFVYSGVQGYPGWNTEQMLLFQAVLLLWTGVSDFLFGGIRQFIDNEVTYGNFDRFFLWPPHALVSLFTRGTNIYASATAFAGLVGVVVMLGRLGITPGPASVATSLLFFASGLLFYVSLLIFYSACTLFMVKMERLREVLDRVQFFGSFPADLYAGRLGSAFLLVFPMALWVHLPAQALLGRVELAAAGALLPTIAFFLAALCFWRRQERRYTSAGG